MQHCHCCIRQQKRRHAPASVRALNEESCHREDSRSRGNSGRTSAASHPPPPQDSLPGPSPFKHRSSEIGLSQYAYLTPSPPDTLFHESSWNPGLQAQIAPSLPKYLGPRPSAPILMASAAFVPSTVKTLGPLTGSQLLHIRPGELQMLCPQEAPRVLARLEAVRRMLGVRTLWGPDPYWKYGMFPGQASRPSPGVEVRWQLLAQVILPGS